MLQESVIREMILWIEKNLESRLSLDTVAEKSGYTKWHFQRLFKNQTGLALGSYIRARRLSCSAVALRLTNDSIMDISLRYRFDSQQTFCRAFKKQFNITPSEYRKRTGWKIEGFCLPLRESKEFSVKVSLTKLDPVKVIGKQHRYTKSINEWYFKTQELRRYYWRDFINEAQCVTTNMYAIHGVDSINDQEGQFCYTTTFEESGVDSPTPNLKSITLPAGDYLQIKFTCDELHGIDYNDIIYTVYGKVLASMDIARGEGCDIENYVLKSTPDYKEFIENSRLYLKELNYYIPVII